MSTQVVPDKTTLARYLSRGLTQKQIVDAWENDSGMKASRSAIAMAITRYGLKSSHPRPRYEDTIPWVVKNEHIHHNDARMLRLEGRRRQGKTLSEDELRWLTKWRTALEVAGAVIHYDPLTEQGFYWVVREAKDNNDIIRRPA